MARVSSQVVRLANARGAEGFIALSAEARTLAVGSGGRALRFVPWGTDTVGVTAGQGEACGGDRETAGHVPLRPSGYAG